MAQIPDSVIEEILNKADIESVVGKYVSFTKRTGQNLFGLCPFHSEKTGSFSVSLNKNIYHCFGCNKGGNAIKFIMEIERLSYPEAIRFLGNQYGVEVPEYTSSGNENFKNRKKRVYELLNEAGKYYYKCFNDPAGKPGRDYAKNRELGKDTLTKFGIGYAPDSWDSLYTHLRSKGYTDEEMKDCGLFTVSRKGNLIDLFRGRLVFPIFDAFGKIIAFGGRSLGPEMPKYVNSPDSLVYKKQEHLYALNYAIQARSEQLIIVEGYMDAISMHQAGINNAVASLGTAFTDSQLRLAAKYAKEVVFFFDSDKAGQNAAIRAIRMMLTFLKKMNGINIRIKIAKVPDGKDPDEYIKHNGAASFRGVVNGAKDVDDYLFSRAYDDNCDEHGKLDTYKFQDDVIMYGSWLHDDLKREKMATNAASYLGANSQTVLNRMNDLMQSEENRQYEQNLRQKKRLEEADLQGRMAAQEADDSYEAPEEAQPTQAQASQTAQAQQPKRKGPPVDIAYTEELALLVYAVRLKERLATEVDRADVLRPNDFTGANMKAIVTFFLEHFDANYGCREDMLLNKMAQLVLNGMPAEEVYLQACEANRKPVTRKAEVDTYLLKVYDLRLKQLDKRERQLTSRLATATKEQKEEYLETLRKIDVARKILREKRGAI